MFVPDGNASRAAFSDLPINFGMWVPVQAEGVAPPELGLLGCAEPVDEGVDEEEEEDAAGPGLSVPLSAGCAVQAVTARRAPATMGMTWCVRIGT